MSGLGDPSGTRLVCLVDDDHAELGRLASRLRVMGWTSSAAWLENIAVRYADAPADPAEAANISLGEYFDSPPGTPHYAQCEGAAAAVLAALGVPANPANEEHHA